MSLHAGGVNQRFGGVLTKLPNNMEGIPDGKAFPDTD
jgi:hypothetical protein